MDADLFKAAMGGVCGPVTVITTKRTDGGPHGTTVSAMMSLSLDPMLVVVSLATTSELLAQVRSSGRIGVNVLSLGQEDAAMTFARSGDDDQFADVAWSWDNDLPRLAGVGVWIAGEVEQFVPGGDHELLLTRVVHAAVEELPPLVYARRAFGTHSGLLPEG